MVEDFLDRSGARPSDGSSSSRSLGRLRNAAADRQHLLLAAREQPGALVEALLEARKIAVDALEIARHGVAVAAQERTHGEIFGDGQEREDFAAFGHVARARA